MTTGSGGAKLSLLIRTAARSGVVAPRPVSIERMLMGNFAVIQTGGKQYLVREGDTLRVEKIDAKQGAGVKLDVLLVSDEAGKETKVGAPLVKGASASAKVVGAGRADKIVVVKFHAKARYKRKAGHRQHFTELKIESIKA